MPTIQKQQAEEVVRYSAGGEGFRDAASYDAVRYRSPANRYKQRVMARAYRPLLGSLAGKRVLDVGCGTGRGVNDVAATAGWALGVDASFDMLSFARHNASADHPPAFAVSVAQHLPLGGASFDVVVSLNFLHLFTPETQRAMIAEMKRVAKPGGRLVLEFDNALHGALIGPLKRWRGREQGSLPREIRFALGGDCRVRRIQGAVIPVLWRWFHYFPALFLKLEALTHWFPFYWLGHRIYYEVEVVKAISAHA